MANKQFTFRSDTLQFKTEGKLKSERKYYIEGYASTTEKDLAGEVINDKAQTSMLKQFRNRNITIDVEHEEWYDDAGKQLPKPKGSMIPVAKVIEARQDSKGTWIKAEMNNNITRFKEVWGSIKGGFLNSFSIGFFPITQVGNVISDLNIVNLTLTGTPVNAGAKFTPVLKSAVAYLKSIETENESKMEEPKQEVIEPAVVAPVAPAPVAPAPVVEAPVVAPVNDLKSEEDIKAEVAKEVVAEVKVEPVVAEPVKAVEATVDSKEAELSDLIGKLMESKLQEWETKFLKKDDEPIKETLTEQPVLKQPEASQEVPSKPITPLGMIKAFEKRQGELGNAPKLKALVEETPTEVTQEQKTRSPLSLV